ARRNAGIDITVPLGEEIENIRQPLIIGRGLLSLPAASERRQLIPRGGGQAAIFGESLRVQHIGIKPRSAMERVVIARHLAGEELAGEANWFGSRRACRSEVNVARTFEQRCAVAVGIVDILCRPLDPLDGPVRKLQDDAGTLAGGEFGEGTERRVY